MPEAVTKTNRIGLDKKAYEGLESTLCSGCGHDSITAHIISAYHEMGIDPYSVAKFSGIGCSSKAPAYFISRGYGNNSLHGRMPCMATGALIANRDLNGIGVSGDGDTASIGIGQFCHLVRRNPRMLYVVENNGVYGLTKGQFSATADVGSKLKGGLTNPFPPIDLCGLALELGCGFVARSFSGDHKQMGAILRAALAHDGLSVIDVLSPCITFNNHDGSTKSYAVAKATDLPIHEIGFVPWFAPVHVDYEEGTTIDVVLSDGSKIYLKKLGREHDPRDRFAAKKVLEEGRREGKLLTGILHIDPSKRTYHALSDLPETPLAKLPPEKTRPPREALDRVNQELR